MCRTKDAFSKHNAAGRPPGRLLIIIIISRPSFIMFFKAFHHEVWFKDKLDVLNTYLLVKNLITNIRDSVFFENKELLNTCLKWILL